MNLAPAVSGDVGDTRTVALNGVEDLDDATSVEAHVWRYGVTEVTTLAASVTDATARTITVQLGGAEGWLATAAPGRWFVEYEVTFGATVITWPSQRPDVLQVRAEGD